MVFMETISISYAFDRNTKCISASKTQVQRASYIVFIMDLLIIGAQAWVGDRRGQGSSKHVDGRRSGVGVVQQT